MHLFRRQAGVEIEAFEEAGRLVRRSGERRRHYDPPGNPLQWWEGDSGFRLRPPLEALARGPW